MLTDETRAIIDASRERGWVLEPDAKRLLSMAGLDVPRFKWAKVSREAVTSASEIGYPLTVYLHLARRCVETFLLILLPLDPCFREEHPSRTLPQIIERYIYWLE